MKVPSISSVFSALKKNFNEAKAELQGQAISRGVRYRSLREIDTAHVFFEKDKRDKEGILVAIGRCLTPIPPRRTDINLRTRDGNPMTYFTDGSLRHTMGRTAARSKAAWKARRQVARARWAKRLQGVAA